MWTNSLYSCRYYTFEIFPKKKLPHIRFRSTLIIYKYIIHLIHLYTNLKMLYVGDESETLHNLVQWLPHHELCTILHLLLLFFLKTVKFILKSKRILAAIELNKNIYLYTHIVSTSIYLIYVYYSILNPMLYCCVYIL